jgi:hypothetical protein
VKPSDFAHQIQMTSSFEHWSESTTCEASSERQRCSPAARHMVPILFWVGKKGTVAFLGAAFPPRR